jgi:ankyrin repeat protein
MGSGMPSTNQKQPEWKMASNWNSEFIPFRPMEQERSSNLTALHFAARTGSPELVDLFFRELGMKINVQDDDGCTPLHIAAQAGHVNIVERFLGQDPALTRNPVLVKKWVFIYLCQNERKHSHFGNFETNFRGQIQCQNEKIKVFDHP